MPATEKYQELVNQLPDLDKHGKVDGPPPEAAAKLFDALIAGGTDAVDTIIGMVNEVDDGADYKARYALHGLAMRCGSPDRAGRRAMLNRALVAQLKKPLPTSIKTFLIQQALWVGGDESVQVLATLLHDEKLKAPATAALQAIGTKAALQALRQTGHHV